MLDWFFNLIARILKIWDDLSDEKKEAIIEFFTSIFEEFFRAFYRTWKTEQ
jgi:hypothetical protein